MSIARPETLEYDEELYSRLEPRGKEVLYRLFNLFCDSIDHRPIEKGAFDADHLKKILAGKLQTEIETFLQRHSRLVDNNVRLDPAIEYISSHYDIDPEKLDIGSRYELMLLIYEEELLNQFDDLIIRSIIRSYSASRTYTVPESLQIDDINEAIDDFHEVWNQEQSAPNAVRVTTDYSSDQMVVLKIHQEIGHRSLSTFAFRLDGREDVPTVPELKEISYQKLKTIRFKVEPYSGETELVFTESFSQWYSTLDKFFEIVFSMDDIFDVLREETSESVVELEEQIVDSVESDEDPVERTREKIGDLREEAEEEIDELDIPTDRKNDLKERIETIEISGSEIIDDQSIKTQEFRLIAGLDGLFSSVDGIEEGFREMVRQAQTENRAFVLTINDRPVQFTQGTWESLGPGGLPDKDERALEIFFSD